MNSSVAPDTHESLHFILVVVPNEGSRLPTDARASPSPRHRRGFLDRGGSPSTPGQEASGTYFKNPG